jgi:hypothetical protein
VSAAPKPKRPPRKPPRPRRTYTVVPAEGADPAAADDTIARWLSSLEEGPQG